VDQLVEQSFQNLTRKKRIINYFVNLSQIDMEIRCIDQGI
jgi:hypothetical protein